MRILNFADFHLGVKTHGKIDPISGLNTREIQTLGVLDELIDYAIDNKVDVIIAAGDMYKNNLPTPTLQDEFNARIKRAADAGILCLILDGNHDVSKMDTAKSALKQFETLNVKNIVHTKFHKEHIFNGVKFVFLPTYHTKESIEKIVNNTKYDMPVIFIGHMTIKGALLNDWLIEDKEVYIDTDVFIKPKVLAVVLGHLHKHQILNQDPLIFYTGSTQRIDFNEEKQPKGFVIMDIDDTTHEIDYKYIEIESQKFYTLKLNLIGNSNPTETIIKELEDNTQKIKNAIVRVKIEVDELTIIDERKIYERVYELGAFNMLDIQKVFDKQEVVKNSELTEHISIEKGLEIFYQDKPRAQERIKLGKEIIKQVEGAQK